MKLLPVVFFFCCPLCKHPVDQLLDTKALVSECTNCGEIWEVSERFVKEMLED